MLQRCTQQSRDRSQDRRGYGTGTKQERYLLVEEVPVVVFVVVAREGEAIERSAKDGEGKDEVKAEKGKEKIRVHFSSI